MWNEYGYMEDGKLGKPYNLRLLKRLAGYASPYRKRIIIALSLTVLITFLELAVPYLSKIAIDRYILSSWYRIDLELMEKSGFRLFMDKYGSLVEKTGKNDVALIARKNLKAIDPSDLNEYEKKGILSKKGFYRIPEGSDIPGISASDVHGALLLDDGYIALPLEYLNALPPGVILELRAGDVKGVAFVGGALLLILILSFGLGYGEYCLLELTGQNIMLDIRLRLFRHLQNQALSFFDRHPVGRLLTRVTNDVENLNEMFKSVIITVFKDIFILSGIIVVLLYLNWRLALVCFILIPFIFTLTLLFSTMAREAFRELRAAVAKINAFLQERITGMRIIQLYVREAFQMGRFADINHENYIAGMKQIRVFALFMPIMELFSSFAVALLIWHGGGKVIGEQLSLGSLVAFVSYIRMFFRPIRDISEKYNIMQSAMASTERIIEFMDHHEEIKEPEDPVRIEEIDGRINLEEIAFAYRDGKPVLDNISFEVRPGEIVAIVGATGAGKTTIVNLIERFYERDSGKILLDGIDIRGLTKKDLRSQIGFVMQDVFIFAGSLRDNIVLGREEIDEEIIKNAIKQANAAGFIEKLPMGIDQEIGEGGSTLSAGERQLLSFARALAHNPKVLILDEATSSVDPETDRLIQDAISRMTKARTTLVIAHRLSTIRNADRILVMHKGHIREEGTHEELMALKGFYFKLNRYRKSEANGAKGSVN